MPKKVYLIGEHHWDIQKSARYSRAFEMFDPDVISIEASSNQTEEIFKHFREKVKRATGQNFQDFRRQHPINYRAARNFVFGIFDIPEAYAKIKSEGVKAVQVAYIDKRQKELSRSLSEKYFREEDESAIDEEWISVAETPLDVDIIIRGALGPERHNRLSFVARTYTTAVMHELIDLLLKGTDIEIETAQTSLDCFYFVKSMLNRGIFTEFSSELQIEERDAGVLERILSFEGIVVHQCGMYHSHGNYNNLYKKLKDKKVPVERHKLIDFAYPSLAETLRYRKVIKIGAIFAQRDAKMIARSVEKKKIDN